MKNPSSKYLKIGQAAKVLGVSIDTLRRWEKSGKIKAIRTPGGTRLYSLAALKKVNPDSVTDFQAKSLSTEELLKRAEESQQLEYLPDIVPLPQSPAVSTEFPKATKFLIGISVVLLTTLVATALMLISSLKGGKTEPAKRQKASPNVLAVTAASKYLEINSDTQINGTLSVRDSINGLSLEATPSANTLTLISGNTQLTVTKSAKLDQDVSTTSSPTFASLTNGTNKFTFPSATTTLIGTDTTDTLTNKSISGSTNTLTNIPNSALTNNKVTVTSGTNLTGGGDITLGSSITLALKDSPSITGALTVSGATILSSTLAVTGATTLTGAATLSSTLSVSGATTLSSTLGVSSGLSVGSTYYSLSPPTSGAIIAGNVGIGTSAPGAFALNVAGNTNITGNLTTSGSLTFSSLNSGSVIFAGTGGALSQNTPSFYWDNTNNRLGIGTSAPSQSFQINTNTSNPFVVTSGGNVGLGTTTPAAKLDIEGGSGTGGIKLGNATVPGENASAAYLDYSATAWNGTNNTMRFFSQGADASTRGAFGFAARTSNQTSEIMVIQTTSSGNVILAQQTGNVGIGNTNPNAQLTVANGAVFGYGANTSPALSSGAIAGFNGNVGIGTTTTNAALTVIGGITTTGNVGIANSAPSYTLDVVGTARISGASTFSSTGSFSSTLTASNGLTLTTGALNLTSTSGQANLALSPATNAFTVNGLFGIDTQNNRVGVGNTAPVQTFQVNSGTSSLVVTSAGNVGIGFTSPAANLHVVGTTQFNGATTHYGNILVGADTTYDLGSASVRWNNLYAYSVTATNIAGVVTSGSTSSSDWLINSTNTSDSNNSTLSFKRGSPTNAVLQWYGNNNTFDFNSGVRIGYNNNSSSTISSGTGLMISSGYTTGLMVNGNALIGYSSGTAASLTNGLAVSGNIGIGTSNTASSLQVNGNAGIGFGTGNFVTPTNGLAVQGNVGIGTTTTNAALTVIGGITTTGNVGIGFTSPNQALQVASAPSAATSLSNILGANGGQLSLTGSTATTLNSKLVLGYDPTNSFGYLQAGSNGSASNLSLEPNGGKVGIGNTSPAFALDIRGGSGDFGWGSATNATTGILTYNNGSAVAIDTLGAGIALDLRILGSNKLVIDSTGNTGIGANVSPSQVFQVNPSASNPFVVTSAGNVGVGVTSPAATLDVSGNVRFYNSRFVIGTTLPDLTKRGARLALTPTSGTDQIGMELLAIGDNTSAAALEALHVTAQTAASAYTVADVMGVDVRSPNLGVGSSATNVTGIRIRNQGTANVTTAYGLYLDAQSGASSSNYSIYSAGGINYFGGNVGVGYATIPGAALAISGNVGIGTSSAGTNLQVTGNGSFGYGAGTSVSSSTGLAVSGNVGVGTTSPLANLHVVGQCVTGDTRLKRRRRRKGKNCEWIDEWEDVRIDEIKPGDEILTLDEKTGKFVTSKVNALMDMGKKQTYLLVTEFGKHIRTTSEHPYFVRDPRWIEPPILPTRVVGSFEVDLSGHIEDTAVRTIVSIANAGFYANIIITQDLKKKLQKYFKIKGHLKYFGPRIFASAIIKIIKQANLTPGQLKIDLEYPGYLQEIDYILNRFYPDMLVSFGSVGKHSPAHFAAYGAYKGKLGLIGFLNEEDIMGIKKDRDSRRNQGAVRGQDELNQSQIARGQSSVAYYKPLNLSSGDWVKVKNLKTGLEVATIDGWERIVSITEVTREQVFDIEVEGTHNFVGNNIVAHNTFITGNVGIGAAFTSSGVVTPTNGLAVQGNVGIGTTTTTHNLEVVGTANFSGNTTIGGTLAVTGTSTFTGTPTFSTMNSGSVLFAGTGGALSQNTPSFYWDNTNNRLGIGTSAPSQSFQVNTNTSNPVVITSGGNIGIGLTSPVARLQILNAGSTPTVITSGTLALISDTSAAGSNAYFGVAAGNTGVAGLTFGKSSDTNRGSISYTNGASGTSAEYMSLLVAGERMRITATGDTYLTGGSALGATPLFVGGQTGSYAGNVGIGTTGPTQKLHVYTTTIADGIFVDGNTDVQFGLMQAGALKGRIGVASATNRFVTGSVANDIVFRSENTNMLFSTNGGTSVNLDITSGGNIGIGSSAAINGAVGALQVGPAAAPAAFFVGSNGNVGVGTTTPLSNLHVVGQCVAEGTRIRRRRKNKKGQWEEEPFDGAQGEDIPVEDIKPGDEVLSLDDNTGEWEWREVEATLDKGIQTVYRLQTESGKWIETTKEHPYLVVVPKTALSSGLIASVDGKPTIVPHTVLLEIYHKTNSLSTNNTCLRGPDGNRTRTHCVRHSRSTINLPAQNTEALPLSQIKIGWVKVSHLKVGMHIATTDGWEKIISIQKTDRKQTYDLQIEGTHNFVGNDIVAHNTFITGNVGIGAAFTSSGVVTPTNGLAVQGNVGIGTTTTSYNLTVIGNGSFSTGILTRSSLQLGIQGDGIINSGSVAVPLQIGGTSGNVINIDSNSNTRALTISAGAVTVGGALTASSTLGVTGATTLSSTLAVTGVTTLSANNAALSFTGTTPSITSGSSVFGLFAGGNVGIGTTGNVYGGLTVRGAGTGTNITLQTYGSGLGQGLTVLDNGSVGIGTTGPSVLLEEAKGSGAALGPIFKLRNTGGLALDQEAIDFASGTATNGTENRARIASIVNGVGQGILNFFTGPGNTTFGFPDMSINNGNVGIGTSGPTAALSFGSASTINILSGNLTLASGGTTSNIILSPGSTGSVQISPISPGPDNPSITRTVANDWLRIQGGGTGTGLTLGAAMNLYGGSYTNPGLFSLYTPRADLAADLTRLNITGGVATANFSILNSNVGIGTSFPSQLFQVNTNTSNPVVITSGGNVGIGFTSPNQALQVASAPSAATSLSNILGANGSQLSLTGNTATTLLTKLAIGMDTTNNFGYLQAGNNGSASNLSLEPSGGNVGIGFTSPAALLHLNSSNPAGIRFTQNGGNSANISLSGSLFQIDNTNPGASDEIRIINQSASGPFTAYTAGAERFRITSSGNVGIGFTSPASTLEVKSTASSAFAVGANGTQNSAFQIDASAASAATGLKITAAAATGGVTLTAISSAASESLTINPKGSGTVTIGSNSTVGGLNFGGSSGGPIAFTSPTSFVISTTNQNGSNAFTVGINSTTNPVFNVDTSTSGAVTGLKIKGNSAGNGVALSAISSGTNENLTLDAKGSGALLLQTVATGNVGIGTSAAGAALQVNGGGLFGWGTTSSALSSGAILGVNGNVGVGTTSPLANLHVVGQCVAEGTRIRRRRKNKKGQWEEEPFDGAQGEDIPVEDIKPGDEVLSLDDNTGEWEWREVEATLDKGIQTVYRLQTESGKWIETTKEHPYLVKDNSLFTGTGLFVESNIGQKTGDYKHAVSNDSFNSEIIKIKHNYFPLFLNMNANDKDSIVDPKGNVNNTIFETISLSEENKTAIANAIQPAAKFTNNSDSIEKKAGSNVFTTPTLSDNKLAVKTAKWLKVFQLKIGMEVATISGWEKIIKITKIGRKQTYDLQIEGTHNFVGGHYINRKTGQALTQKQEEAYYYYLHQKTTLADGLVSRTDSLNGWIDNLVDNITQNDQNVKSENSVDLPGVEPGRLGLSIQPSKPARPTPTSLSDILGIDVNEDDIVYGGIVAHNTFITGNVGIGAAFTSSGVVSPTNGLAVQGNVGIGTTSTTHNLEVTGTGAFSSTLTANTFSSSGVTITGGTINGTSIGATTPSTGAFTTLTSSGATTIGGTLGVTGATTLSSTAAISGALTLSANNAALSFTGTTPSLTSGSSVFGIFASGNVGIGTTATMGSTFNVNGNQVIGSSFIGGAAPTNGLGVQGNVGIGTTSTTHNLEVVGTANISGALTTGGTPTFSTMTSGSVLFAGTSGILSQNNSNFYWDNTNNRLGIGTSAPTEKLDVVGRLSLKQGNDGVFIGSGAGQSFTNINTTGDVLIGYQAGFTLNYDSTHPGALDNGGYSVFLGYQAGYNTLASGVSNYEASRNNFIGFKAGYANTTGLANTAEGLLALASNTTGSNNQAFGYQSGYSITTGSNNTFVGYNAGYNGSQKVDAVNSMALGNGAYTTASNQVVIGNTSVTQTLLNGNVGIGSSAAGAALQVNGGGLFGWGTTSTALSSGAIAGFNGNVGVGTTSPLANLHVVGQCVAEGTRIRRRRKNKKGQWEEEPFDGAQGEDIPVEDIKPGDEVLSLNDQTGQWEWNTVEATLDKGIQEVYRLQTESGKWIETTSQHPYLVRLENSHQKTTLADGFIASVVGKPTNGPQVVLSAIYHKISKLSSNSNKKYLRGPDGIRTRSHYLGGSWSTISLPAQVTEALLLSQITTNWVKVALLKPGMEIATISGWEKIVGISKVGRKQTYDLQIEGTHNFVGNDIVAHNTFITGNVGIGAAFTTSGVVTPTNGLAVQGNVGIGTTTANSTLSVSGSTHIGSLYQGTAAPANGLFVDGNVGIGATTSSNKLDVWGNARIAGTGVFDSTLTANTFSSSGVTITGGTINGTSVGATTASTGAFTTLTSSGNSTIGTGASLTNTFGTGTSAANTIGASGGTNAINGATTILGTTLINSTGTAATTIGNSTGTLALAGTTFSLTAGSGLNVTTGGALSGISTISMSGVLTNSSSNQAISLTGTNPSITTSGTNPLGIFAGGNVGIGTTGNVYGGLTVRGAGTGTNITLQTYGSGLGQGLTVLDNGSVGIGTTGPGTTLDVTGTGRFSSTLTLNGWVSQPTSVGINTGGARFIGTSNQFAFGGESTQNAFVFTNNVQGVWNTSFNHGTPSTPTLFFQDGTAPSVTDNKWGSLTHDGTGFVITTGANTGTGSAPATIDSYIIFAPRGTEKVRISGSGNVGIGTISPGSALAVNGGGLFGWGTASTSLSSGAILGVNGNVGVGTTTPLANLHVVGQCVAWDTRIRIRRRKRKGNGEDDILEWDYLEVIIKDILAGDEVLSLNEVTQEFEYQKVEKLLDMGSKGVYELTTLSGRKIKTTANHPYLVFLRDDVSIIYQSPIQDAGWVKVINLKVGDKIAVADNLSSGTSRLLAKDIPDYSKGNNSQKESNLRLSNLWGQINHDSSNISSALTAKYQDTITPAISTVNTNGFLVANIATNQPAAKLEQTAEKILNWATDGSKENLIIQNSSIDTSIYRWPAMPALSEIEGSKVEWDTIASIKYLGYEHVYDLQIENTHNFLGNNIVAHNTYITGNVGLGALSNNIKLQLTGNGTGTGVNLLTQNNTQTNFGLAVLDNGNVGIGTSTPGVLLDVSVSSTTDPIIRAITSATTVGGSMSIVQTGGGGLTFAKAGAADQFLTGSVAQDAIIKNTSNTALLFGTNNLERMRITSGGNVGIGTASPLSQLANSSANILDQSGVGLTGSKNITWTDTAAGYVLGINQGSSASSAMGALIKIAGTANTNSILTLNSNGTDRFTVTGAGNVGIGFTSPTTALWVGSGNPAFWVDNSASSAATGLKITSAAAGSGVTLGVTSSAVNENFSINSLGTGSITINGPSGTGQSLFVKGGGNGSGNGGIVLQTPSNSFTNWLVSASQFTNNNFELIPSTTTGGTTFSKAVISITPGGNVGIGTSASTSYGALQVGPAAAPAAFFVGSTGSVGVGTTTPNDRLDVQGGNIRNSVLAGVGNRAVYSDANGVLTNSASDIRLKTNITNIPANIDVLGALNQLRGVYFNWDQNNPDAIHFGPQRELGMIAQEVEKVLPELVGTNANGYKSLNYAQMAGFLVEVGKAQQTLINSLTTQQASASAQLTKLTITSDGNVGIGTSAPAGALHVVGQCVTGDTRLKRRRRRKGKKGEWIDEWEDVRIDEIKPGDEILTLDEGIGRFVTSKVKALKEMGIKDIYELTTISGKTIRTTGNHPYLVMDQKFQPENFNTNLLYYENFEKLQDRAEQFYKQVLEGETIKVPALNNQPVYFSREGWNHLMEEKKSRFETMARFFGLPKILPVLLLAKDATYEKSRLEPGTNFWALQGIIEGVWVKVIIRETKDKPKHFYSIIWKGEEHRSEVKNAIKKDAVSRLYPRRQAWETLTFSTFNWNKYNTFVNNLQASAKQTMPNIIPFVKNVGRWTKVSELRSGRMIATIGKNGQPQFEKIVSIKKTKKEQVFDIEVEGTHNFLGNDIVAHNTAIFEGGNVGIGTTSPKARLDVIGNTNITGALSVQNSLGQNLFSVDASGSAKLAGTLTTQAGAFDVAEDYQAENGVEAGDIVAISTDSPQVEKTTSAYQNNVLGVISTKAALRLRSGSSTLDSQPVALAGRVPVKVSTENGAIQQGDYLTSSSIPGVAMKATRPGQVIGKSLEEFTGGEGKILVFVSIGFADPGNFLSSLSLDDQGNLIIPKIKTSSITLDPTVADSKQLAANNQQLTLLEDRIKKLESKVEKLEATASATPSAVLTEATPSAKLTPPDILLATASATLTNLTTISEATVSGKLTAYDLNIQNSLKSLGTTSLGNATIAGDLTVDGTFSVENGNEINVMGKLFLQKSILAQGLDIFNGKVTIDQQGNITTLGILTAAQVKTSKLTIANTTTASGSAALAASIGTATLPANTASITIPASAVSASSKIFVTPITPTDKVLSVTNIKAGESFAVSVLIPASADIKFNWWIVQIE